MTSVLKHTLIETLAAQIFVLPLLIYMFGQISLISPLANVLALPAVPYAMGVGFFAVLLEYVWHPFAVPMAIFTWILLAYITNIIGMLARVPLAAVEVGGWAVVPALFVTVSVVAYTLRGYLRAYKNLQIFTISDNNKTGEVR